jgi:hypothetical protein
MASAHQTRPRPTTNYIGRASKGLTATAYVAEADEVSTGDSKILLPLMYFGPKTQRFLIALVVVALLFTIWQVTASPVDPADIKRALGSPH